MNPQLWNNYIPWEQLDLDLKNKTALLLVDIQKGLDNWEFYGGHRNNPKAENNAAKILKAVRKLNWPIFHIRHSSTNPKSPLHASKPGFQINDEVLPLKHEPVITKNVNSAFIGTDLEERLKAIEIGNLIIVGLTTNHCVSTTTRMAANLGFTTYLISDATAAFRTKGVNGVQFDEETMHQTALASLNGEFAQVLETKELLEIMT